MSINNKYRNKSEVLEKWIKINKRLNKNKDTEYNSRTIVEAQNLLEIIISRIIAENNLPLKKDKNNKENNGLISRFKVCCEFMHVHYSKEFIDKMYNIKEYRNNTSHGTMTIIQNVITFEVVQKAINVYGEALFMLGLLDRDNITINVDKLMAKEGDIIDSTIVLNKLIGEGASGKVFLGFHQRLGINVAVKELNHNLFNESLLKNEKSILLSLKYKNIPTIYDVIEDNRTCYIIMEYINGTNLYNFMNRVKSLNDNVIIKIMLQLCDTIRYLHSLNIVHNDLKPSNILVDNQNNIYVIDYGIASNIKGNQLENIYSGTRAYASPLKEDGINDIVYNDIYSLGGILYFLCEGMDPRKGSEQSFKSSTNKKFISIIQKAMNGNKDSSYTSIDELKNDIVGKKIKKIKKDEINYKFDIKTNIAQNRKKDYFVYIGIAAIAIVCLFFGIKIIHSYLEPKVPTTAYIDEKDISDNLSKDDLINENSNNENSDSENLSSDDSKNISANSVNGTLENNSNNSQGNNDSSQLNTNINTVSAEGMSYNGKVKISINNYQINGSNVIVSVHVENNYDKEIVFWPSEIYLLNENGNTFSLDEHLQLQNEPGQKNVPAGTNKDYNFYFSGYSETASLTLKIDYIWSMSSDSQNSATEIKLK